MNTCRECGCSENNACVKLAVDGTDTVETCHWVEHDLCSACRPGVEQGWIRPNERPPMGEGSMFPMPEMDPTLSEGLRPPEDGFALETSPASRLWARGKELAVAHPGSSLLTAAVAFILWLVWLAVVISHHSVAEVLLVTAFLLALGLAIVAPLWSVQRLARTFGLEDEDPDDPGKPEMRG